MFKKGSGTGQVLEFIYPIFQILFSPKYLQWMDEP